MICSVMQKLGKLKWQVTPKFTVVKQFYALQEAFGYRNEPTKLNVLTSNNFKDINRKLKM